MKEKKILIVDDDVDIVEIIKVALGRDKELELISAFDGMEALNKIEKDPPHLIILDVKMPRLDGYELCKIVKRRYASIPVIILTAKSAPEDKKKGFSVGASDYIVKPFDLERLQKAVKRHLPN